MNTAWCIDWLSMTFKRDITDLDIRKGMSFGFPLKTWTQTQPRFGYAVAFTHPFGHSVMANYNRPEMGVHLSMTGRALKSLAEGGVSSTTVLDWSLAEGAKMTRIDLAIDVFDVAIDIAALKNVARVSNAPGSAKKMRLWQDEGEGCTLYIGARSSEKFLRIYDKAAEQGLKDRPWVRFELELKGQAARTASIQMSLLSDKERPLFIQGLIKALFNPDDPLFQSIMASDAVTLQTTKDTEDNTIDWLLNTVAKTIAKTIIRRSDIDLWSMFQEAIRINLEQLEAHQ